MADHALLLGSKSTLGPRRIDGNRLSEGKGCPPSVTIIGTPVSGQSALDAGAIGGKGSGSGLALATTARPKRRGRSLTFHERTSPQSVPSSATSSRARLGPRCAGGKTPDNNCSYQNLTLVSSRSNRNTGRPGGIWPSRKWNHCHTAFATGGQEVDQNGFRSF